MIGIIESCLRFSGLCQVGLSDIAPIAWWMAKCQWLKNRSHLPIHGIGWSKLNASMEFDCSVGI